MTSRRSSGSMRADSAVEPTKSENITVTWRRSAVSRGDVIHCHWSDDRAQCGLRVCFAERRSHRSNLRRCPSSDAKLLQVLIRQDREDRSVYLVLAECCLILSEAQAPQPDHNVHATFRN